MQRQRPAQYQGLYMVRADGRGLASHQNFKSYKTWPREVLADLQPDLRAFGKIEPRHFQRVDSLPNRGVETRRDGSVCLAVFLRDSIKGVPLREAPNPTLNSLVLRAAELRTDHIRAIERQCPERIVNQVTVIRPTGPAKPVKS